MPNYLTRTWSALMAGYQAFQEKMVTSDQVNILDYTDFDARKLRYSILWAMYENTAYDSVHTWAESYKTKKGLYKYIRNIYNPSFRIGNFWQAKLLGGKLDPEAGDGKKIPSALPIVTKNNALRSAIAQIWKWSNWQTQKDMFGLWGAVLGDGILKIVDDPKRQRVYIRPEHPSHLKDIELDPQGNVKYYELEYKIPDPLNSDREVTYKEIAERDGAGVIYRTFRNNALFAYEDNPSGDTALAEWREEYGFIPMVFVKHNDVGLDYGWSELYPGLSKFREVDDQASKLHDQIRKLVEGAWMFAGVADPATKNPTGVNATVTARGKTASTDNPQPGRTEMKIFYTTNENAKPHSLVSPIDVADVSASIQTLIKELERDYPELRVDIDNATGEISGKAIRENRSSATERVELRRPRYDDALVRAQQMAISICAQGKYPGFDAFSETSYESGQLDHSIGDRPVFALDPMDKLEEERFFLENAEIAVKKLGIPLPVYLRQQGWDENRISEIEQSEEYQNRLEAQRSALESLRNANTANNEGAGTSSRRRNRNEQV